MDDKEIQDLILGFDIAGELKDLRSFGGGHINDTYLSTWLTEGGATRYIHQRINEKVFHRPDWVMENVVRVTDHCRARLLAEGAEDIGRRVLTVIPPRSGEPWLRDSEGGWWRCYRFIEGSRAESRLSSPDQALLIGAAIGRFHNLLADLPSPPLRETIPRFHDMSWRYANFDESLGRDRLGRASRVAEEIAFFQENRERGQILSRALAFGALPSRACHNDAKLDNILLDEGTGAALCVVDLDTTMPGTVLFDFGDLVRTAAATAPEDEAELDRVRFSPVLYRALAEGYLSQARPFLTREEHELLPEAGRSLAQIMGLRFLTDYLEGDRYYKIARPSHNLDRCRNQIALIQSMDEVRKELGAGFGDPIQEPQG